MTCRQPGVKTAFVVVVVVLSTSDIVLAVSWGSVSAKIGIVKAVLELGSLDAIVGEDGAVSISAVTPSEMVIAAGASEMAEAGTGATSGAVLAITCWMCTSSCVRLSIRASDKVIEIVA